MRRNANEFHSPNKPQGNGWRRNSFEIFVSLSNSELKPQKSGPPAKKFGRTEESDLEAAVYEMEDKGAKAEVRLKAKPHLKWPSSRSLIELKTSQ